jgi:hypothetical protein
VGLTITQTYTGSLWGIFGFLIQEEAKNLEIINASHVYSIIQFIYTIEQQ